MATIVKDIMMDIASIAHGEAFIASSLGEKYDNGLRNSVIIQSYEKAIEFAKYTLNIKAYSQHYNYNYDTYYVEHNFSKDGMSDQIRQWQSKISEI